MPIGSIHSTGQYTYIASVGFGPVTETCSGGGPGFPIECFSRFSGRFSQTVQGTLLSISAISSPLGSGWGLAGWQELVENADGSVLLIDGSGSTVVFSNPVAGVYDSPPETFRPLRGSPLELSAAP